MGSRGMGGQVGEERESEVMLRNVDFTLELGAGSDKMRSMF